MKLLIFPILMFFWVSTCASQTMDTLCNVPAGPRLLAVDFADLLHGYACGRGGRILKTIDGGWTWVNKPTGITDEIRSIACPTPQEVYACTSGGLLIFSQNAGQSWDTIRLGTSPLSKVVYQNQKLWVTGSDGKLHLNPHLDLGSFTFTIGGSWAILDQLCWLNPQIGFLMADSLNAFTGKTVPYRTTDGGQTWQRSISIQESAFLPVVEYRDFSWDNLHHITMRPDSTLLLTGGYYPGYVWKSTDKGLTFSIVDQVLQSNPQQIQAFDNTRIALISWEGDALRPYIARSHDGGNSWPSFISDTSLFKLKVYFKPSGKSHFFGHQTAFIPGYNQLPNGEEGAILRVSTIFNESTATISNQQNAIDFQLFPNPGSGMGFIQVPEPRKSEKLIWIDALGRSSTISIEENASDPRFDASGLPAGIYTIKYGDLIGRYVKE